MVKKLGAKLLDVLLLLMASRAPAQQTKRTDKPACIAVVK